MKKILYTFVVIGTLLLTASANAGEIESNVISIEVNLQDTTAPTLTLNGEANITLEQNRAYTELGATALEGNISVNISGTVDTSTIGEYILTYTATDSSGNSASVSRMVNVIKKPNQIISLTLTVPQTHFVRKKDSFYNSCIPIKIPLRAIASYQDGHTEDLTDKITWKIIRGKLVKEIDFTKDNNLTDMLREEFHTLYATKGSYDIAASYKGVQSNTLHIEIEDDKKTVQYETEYDKETITVYFLLDKKPSSKVTLPLALPKESNASFIAKYGLLDQNYNVVFEPYMWSEGSLISPPYVKIKLSGVNKEGNITIQTAKLKSSDPLYNNIDPEDITISKLQEPRLDTPRPNQLRGAVRGVQIQFELTEGDRENQTIELVNPPKGMKIKGGIHSNGVPPYGVIVQWDVPLDAEEGKFYTVTAKATNTQGKVKTITFPIKVPKTKPIQTTLKNNELIVTDKSSPLYGMKMKGHSGEDVSNVKLRSVDYEDIQEHPSNQYEINHKLKYTAFIIDNKPPQLDIDLPDILYFGFYRYIVGDVMYTGDPWKDVGPSYLIDAKNAWDSATGRYIIKNNAKGIPQRNEYDDGGNKVYLIVEERK